MIHIDVIAVGRMRQKPLLDLRDDYGKRITWPLILHEIDDRRPEQVETRLLEKIAPGGFLFVLDERGKALPSADFAKRLGDLAEQGRNPVQFIIGGADGLSDAIRARAQFLLSFGSQTWPHMLARIMLIEQIYRAQQILSGHPYHRA